MLGPVGKVAKTLLSRAGYQFRRRTPIEQRIGRSVWADWFSQAPELLGKVYAANRRTLAEVPQWNDPAAIESSLWRYSIPELLWPDAKSFGRTRLNEVELEVTYSDLLGVIGHRIHRLSYLEIGVSLGKNFLQVVKQFPGAEIAGIEYEDLNPVLARQFDRVEIVWQADREITVEGMDRPRRFRPTEYRLHREDGLPVTYIRGDQYDPVTWDRLRGRKFNLIFSDGDHFPATLNDEMSKISERELLDTDGRFALLWDDLNTSDMQAAFEDIALGLPGAWHALYWIDGTFGDPRLNGLAANFRLGET